ncbi:MAG: hypothetical protein WAQ52_18700 [Terriglobales bacterium]
MLCKLGSLFLIVLLISTFAYASTPLPVLSLGVAGVATAQPDTVTVAAPLANLTRQAVTSVKIDRIQLSPATLRTSLPIRVRSIRGHASETVQAEFDSKSLVPGKRYELVMQGTYRTGKEDEDYGKDRDDKGPTRPFRVRTFVVLPPASPGSHDVGKTKVPAHKVEGGRYPPQKPRMDKDVNQAAPPVPQMAFVPGTPTPTSTESKPAPVGDPPAITFNANDPVGINGAGLGCSGDPSAGCAEPSGASGGGVIFVSANWRVAYSTDGGSTFRVLDPTTIFPNDAVGFCCDQIVQYAPSIDRFIWLLQGTGYRLAMASPADIRNSNGTSWTYWNLTPSLFGRCTGPDYPDLSVGDNSLYISWDAGGGAGCTAGFQVVRTSLAGIQAAGTITLEFTDPANAPCCNIWGEHLTQNTGDEIFWAGHNGNTTLTVYSLKEASNTYFWRNVGISSWASNAPTSTTPDGLDWLAKNFNGPGGNSFPRNGIIGAARSADQLWFGWSAGTDHNFQQAHIEIVTLDRGHNFNKVQQVQVWNNSYAFAYPAFSSNGCTGELGMSFEYGGNGNYENHVVGFWGDFVAYITTSSNVGDDRFGDYVSIRRAPITRTDPGNLFTAFGFGLNKQTPPLTGNKTDVRYVLFGRPSCQSR